MGEPVYTRLDEEFKQTLEETADELGMDLSDLLRMLIYRSVQQEHLAREFAYVALHMRRFNKAAGFGDGAIPDPDEVDTELERMLAPGELHTLSDLPDVDQKIPDQFRLFGSLAPLTQTPDVTGDLPDYDYEGYSDG